MRPKKPNKKICPRCKKLKRTKHFVFNKRFKDSICQMCHNSLGNNIYFISLTERINNEGKIGKFSLSNLERDELHDNFVRQGMDSISAWNKVRQHCNMLRRMAWGYRQRLYKEKKREIQQRQMEEQQKKVFLEGLKND